MFYDILIWDAPVYVYIYILGMGILSKSNIR